MRLVYEWIGRLVVESFMQRHQREIRAAAAVGVGVTALAIAAYLASREQDET
jgi:hypothetical protein